MKKAAKARGEQLKLDKAHQKRAAKKRGEQLKVDKEHQSRAGKKGAAARTYEEQAEQLRKNYAKALERYPDLHERAGAASLKVQLAKKEEKRLADEKKALEEAERRRLAGEPEPTPPAPKKPKRRGKSKWERW